MMLGVANVLCRRTRILACLSSVSAETPILVMRAPTKPLPKRLGIFSPRSHQAEARQLEQWGLRLPDGSERE